nr:preC/core protein [Hepatitis B virus]
MQLFTSA